MLRLAYNPTSDFAAEQEIARRKLMTTDRASRPTAAAHVARALLHTIDQDRLARFVEAVVWDTCHRYGEDAAAAVLGQLYVTAEGRTVSGADTPFHVADFDIARRVLEEFRNPVAEPGAEVAA